MSLSALRACFRTVCAADFLDFVLERNSLMLSARSATLRIRLNRTILLISFAAPGLVTLAPSAGAQANYYPNDATVSTQIGGFARVGYANDSDYASRTNVTSPTVNIVSGGGFTGSLNTFGGSITNFSGTVPAAQLTDTSTLNVSGGVINGVVVALLNNTVNITGGRVGQLTLRNQSRGNVSGGTIGTTLRVVNSSVLNFFGTGLGETLVNPDASGYSQYTLSGLLADGTSIAGRTLYVQNGTGTATFTEVSTPEPGSVALFVGMGLSGGVFLRRRRSARKAV
jgi:hypothetical protein